MSLICLLTAVYHSVVSSDNDASSGWFVGALLMTFPDGILINFIWGG